MTLDDFDYRLPEELIAQAPMPKRDASRLLCLDRKGGRLDHRRFEDLPQLLAPDQMLVLNDSRVIPARLQAVRPGREGRIEVLLLNEVEPGLWRALLRPGRKVPIGQRLIFAPGRLEAVATDAEGPARHLRFEWEGDFERLLEDWGSVPLPPYIRRPDGILSSDPTRYQTVYASRPGSVAAPTAGLHLTEALLEAVPHCAISLHVGYGTFQPIRSQAVAEHRMDAEAYHVSPEAAVRINDHRARGGRLTAVGSTATRVLEHHFSSYGEMRSGSGWTDLFIRPGHRFRGVDGLVTNFHLPRSTLLVLVSAFAGVEAIRDAYAEAIRRRYRFYSYGDAMWIR